MSVTSSLTKAKDNLTKPLCGKKHKKDEDEPGKSAGQVEKADGDDDGDEDGDEDGDDDESVDATEFVKAMSERIEELALGQQAILDKIEEVSSVNKAIGGVMVEIADTQEKIAQTPNPRKSMSPLEAAKANLLAKGGFNGAGPQGDEKKKPWHRQITMSDMDRIRPVIAKAVEAHEMDIYDASRLESQINKSILNPLYQIDQKYRDILVGKIETK